MVAELPLDDECVGLAFAKDGRTLVTSTYLGHITVWRMPEGTKLASYDAKIVNHDYNTTFAATPDLSLAAYAMRGRHSFASLICVMARSFGRLWSTNGEYITALAFSPDGKTLASSCHDESNIRLWDVATGKQIGELKGHSSWVSSMVFWPDGKKLASGSGDQTIRIWDVRQESKVPGRAARSSAGGVAAGLAAR